MRTARQVLRDIAKTREETKLLQLRLERFLAELEKIKETLNV